MSFLLVPMSIKLIFPLTNGIAYLDPGSGSFILQLLIASLVGGLFILKTYWKRIRTFVQKRLNKSEDNLEE